MQPWSFQPDIAHLVVNHQRRVPTLTDIRQWTAYAQDLGYRAVRTNALNRQVARQVEHAGYNVLQELVLLELIAPRRALSAAHHPSRPQTKHVAIDEIADASAVDVAAFGREWGLGEKAIADVCAATPRFRMSGVGDPLVGFAISGRDGKQGFLQRLSVSPERQREGIGRALVLDSLEWMTRCRVQRVLVNTAVDNHAALTLYQSLGFRRVGERLRVYERALP